MIQFELFNGLIVVPVVFNYGRSKITTEGIVDTGSAGTALDINLVDLDYSRPSRIVEIAGIGGNQEVVIQTIESVKFCDKTVSNFEVEFGDIASAFGFSAIIGSNLLDAIGACVDYDRKEIRLSLEK